MGRPLTAGEVRMLTTVFGATLPYSRIFCHVINGGHISITPYGKPYFVYSVYCDDFSGNGVPLESKTHFIHELTHVWQYYHGVNVVREAACISRQTRGRYAQNAHDYSLRTNKFTQLNIEQQAAAVEEFYGLSRDRDYRMVYCKDREPRLKEYEDAIQTLKRAGPPRFPNYDFAPDFGNSDSH